MNCFVCGEAVAPAVQVAVKGHPTGAPLGRSIQMHESCATRLVERVLISLHASRGHTPSRQPEPAVADVPLRPVELRILQRLARGESNRQIARHIGVAEKTVKNRMSLIMSKLQCSSRTETAILALRLGLGEEQQS
jgi:DNA-binding NarL/FixJ family response regulator